MEYEERQAWIALWAAVFGEPPPVEADATTVARILVEHLPPAPPYQVPNWVKGTRLKNSRSAPRGSSSSRETVSKTMVWRRGRV